jgi:S-adenosylmethionine hydrolase
MSIIALISDFGTSDWFVGSMKGAILDINPTAKIVDISHHIDQGSIRAAAICLLSSYKSFPKKTIFVVVIDPGVGSIRKAIAAKAGDYLFVAPDNGVLSFVLGQNRNNAKVYHIEKERYFREPVSNTFHGRDIFAPVGAHLSKGLPLASVGSKLKDWNSLSWPELEVSKDGIHGEIIYIDHFGNAFTNITAEALRNYDPDSMYIFIEDHKPIKMFSFYKEVPPGNAIALINSADYVEIAINNGNAAQHFSLSVGSPVRLLPLLK